MKGKTTTERMLTMRTYPYPPSCDLEACPSRGVRCSPCPELKTEDSSRTPITEGLRLFCYYDAVWGTVTDIRDDGWFHLLDEEGRRHGPYNGVRCSITSLDTRGL
jgi:hypothetical protein